MVFFNRCFTYPTLRPNFSDDPCDHNFLFPPFHRKMASNYFMVVAIDFGTTFSGYAFQHTTDYRKEDPTKSIFCPQSWNSGKKQLLSLKTPTCLLLDQNEDIDSFGYEAEEKYANLCMDGDQKKWYFFRRFKMQLMDTKVNTALFF